MKPARFILSLVSVALFLAIGTIMVFSDVVGASGTPMVNWGTMGISLPGFVLLAVLVTRAALLWADNRKEKG